MSSDSALSKTSSFSVSTIEKLIISNFLLMIDLKWLIDFYYLSYYHIFNSYVSRLNIYDNLEMILIYPIFLLGWASNLPNN